MDSEKYDEIIAKLQFFFDHVEELKSHYEDTAIENQNELSARYKSELLNSISYVYQQAFKKYLYTQGKEKL